MSNDESELTSNDYVVLGDVANSGSGQSWSHVSDTSHGEGSSSSWVDVAAVDEAADSGCRDEVVETSSPIPPVLGTDYVNADAVAEEQSTQEQTRARLSKLSLQDNELPTDFSSHSQESPLATPDTKPAAHVAATQETTATSSQADASLTAAPSQQVEDFDVAQALAAEANCPLLVFLASDDTTSQLVQQCIIGTERFQSLLNLGFVFWQTSEMTQGEAFARHFGVQKYPCLAAVHPQDGHCIFKMEGTMEEIPWELDHIIQLFSELRLDLFPETSPNGLPSAPPIQNRDLPNTSVGGIDADRGSGEDGSWKRQRSSRDSEPPGKTTSQPDSTAESDSESGGSAKRIKTASIPSLADLKWQGTYDEALSFAKSVHRTLLVSLQDYSQTGSHMVDQHILFKEQIREIIQHKFVFWQVERNAMEGVKYARHVHAHGCPHVAVINPNYGTCIWGKHGWDFHNPWDVEEVAQMLTDICYEHYAEEQLAMTMDFGGLEYNWERPSGL